MTSFAQKVLTIVRSIPRGATLTYAQVARQAGAPRAYRAVGSILKKNKDYTNIPCHRVIRSDGTVGGYNRGVAMKRRLLKKESRAVV